MRILVTGAAGYVGSVVTQRLVEQGHDVIAMDNLSHGFRQAVHEDAVFEKGDLLDADWLGDLLARRPVEAVVHLAAEARIDDSLRDPGLFYRANVVGGIHLLDAMASAGVRRIVFSSTAAVYGQPERMPITEDAPLEPVNAYGESKLVFERALSWYARAHGLRYVALRYFNVCGATERFGEARRRETHIIPLLFDVVQGRREGFRLFGSDYDTPDGTCIRDYIHVSDIAKAHLLALAAIDRIGAGLYNMGNGNGFSNMEVIETVRRVTGGEIPVAPADRRPGDPEQLVAGSDKIRRELLWEPDYPKLDPMVDSAWQWRLAHPEGYGE